jgi:glycine/D-amino acid oxidase-like deaminating enzyme
VGGRHGREPAAAERVSAALNDDPLVPTALEPTPHDVATMPSTCDVLVVGAGTMGAWSALFAQAGTPDGDAGGGRTVHLLDAWGAGNSRSTSGDENRIIRSAHGPDTLYTRWARRSRELWQRYEAEWGVQLFVPAGVLWFAHRPDAFEAASARTLSDIGVPHEWLDPDELSRRWPQIAGGDLAGALWEPEAGALMARLACRAAASAFVRAGGRYGVAGVRPGRVDGRRLLDAVDESGRRHSAGSFVFACGPWLPRLFPEACAGLIRVTKQDVVYIGPRPGDRRFDATSIPAWADYDAAYYGVPSIEVRGFKLAPDRYGPIFDPSRGERVVDPESVRLARRYLATRFPDLADAPVIETRVCQYESTPDAHFVIAQHPDLDNVWLVGGGSGHGFKHGPRIGEYLVRRLDGVPEGAQDGEDERRFRIGPRSSGAAARTGGDDMAATWELF